MVTGEIFCTYKPGPLLIRYSFWFPRGRMPTGARGRDREAFRFCAALAGSLGVAGYARLNSPGESAMQAENWPGSGRPAGDRRRDSWQRETGT